MSRSRYPANVRLIRTMCSGRVDEKFIWEAFAKGAPVVLVSGCHIGDCHYINANHWTVKRVEKVQKNGKARHPSGSDATGMDQRGRRRALCAGDEGYGGTAQRRKRAGRAT